MYFFIQIHVYTWKSSYKTILWNHIKNWLQALYSGKLTVLIYWFQKYGTEILSFYIMLMIHPLAQKSKQ